MPSAVNIVVSCTHRKRSPSAPNFQLRSLHGSLEARAEQWLLRLQSAPPPFLEARHLYSGDHWSVARSLPEDAAENGVRAALWVCSAGYGLIPSYAQLKPYAATFSPGHDDFIGGKEQDTPSNLARQWWHFLSQWAGPESGTPRTLQALARAMPNTPLMVVLSEAYLNAVAEDLLAALGELSDPDLLLLISAGGSVADLDPYRLPCEARLQTLVGGAMQALNVRIARAILQESHHMSLRSAPVRIFLQRLLEVQPPRIEHHRLPMSDEAVRAFILAAVRLNPAARHTPLLRALRESGYACEQARFAALFQEISGARHGND